MSVPIVALPGSAPLALKPTAEAAPRIDCLHCGQSLEGAQGPYCCSGCEHVHRLLTARGLGEYYQLQQGQGQPALLADGTRDNKWLALVEAELVAREGIRLVQLDIEGLHCTGCVWLIEELFRRSKAPGRVTINPARGTIDLWVDERFALGSFVRDIEGLGYRLGPKTKTALASNDLVLRMGICLALAMNAMIFAISIYAGLDSGPLLPLFQVLQLGLASASFAVGGMVFVRGAFRALKRKILHLDLPIALGVVLGFAGSLWSLIATGGRHAYFDTLTIFIALMLVGRFLRERVIEKNRAQLLEQTGPLGLLARRVVTDEASARVEVVPVTELAVGNQLLIAPGDVIPVGATLEDANGLVSLDWITGESEPLAVRRGERIQAGAANAGQSAITVSASSTFEASGLMDLLKVPRAIDRYGDAATPFEARVSRVWVVMVLVTAALAFSAWLWASHDVERSLGVAIGILVVTCPCAFGIATPIAHEIVLGALRREGLLVRSSSFLERAAHVTRIVFDKTGTLTTGALHLESEDKLRALSLDTQRVCYNLAARSGHPKAAAVRDGIPLAARELLPDLHVVEHAGLGLELLHAGHRYRLGAPRWAAGAEASGDIAFSEDGVAYFVLDTSEELRSDAASEVRELERAGYETWILTGDRRARALDVARDVGIEPRRVIADQSPSEKAEAIQAMDHGDTLMIGDGINDALAVRTASCSGTPGAGRAFLAARTDFYLSGAGLGPVRRALTGARALRKAIRRNLGLAIVYNVLAVSAACAGFMTPLLAAVLMPISSLASVGLAVRTLGGKGASWRS